MGRRRKRGCRAVRFGPPGLRLGAYVPIAGTRLGQDALVPVTAEAIERAVRLVVDDLVATLGWDRSNAESVVRAEAMQWAEPDLSWQFDEPQWNGIDAFTLKVAEEVQQIIHDNWLDTSWPRCPTHTTHPLWLQEQTLEWACPEDGRRYAALGSLRGLSA